MITIYETESLSFQAWNKKSYRYIYSDICWTSEKYQRAQSIEMYIHGNWEEIQ